MILVDTHSHTDASHDGKATLGEMAKVAREKGLQALFLTDHLEIRAETGVPILSYNEEKALKDREILPEGILLPLSVEISGWLDDKAACLRIMGRNPYEFILASVHHIAGMLGFARMEYPTRERCETLLDLYLADVLTTAEEMDFDSLAHLDYPLRYFFRKGSFYFNFASREEMCQKILDTLLRRGKSLELNTATLRKGYPHLPEDLFRLYRSMGGKYVTVGSDAHAPGDLAADFSLAEDFLTSLGFEGYTFYRHRQPIFVRFDQAPPILGAAD